MMRSNNALENGRSQASLRSLARAVQRGRYAAFDAARAFLCAMAAIGQKPDIRLREEMGVDIG
jgi:hypothetical protein